MLETPHVAVAAAIAYKIPNPIISIPLAITSHFVFDMYPHWNPKINTEKKKYGKITPKSMTVIAVDVILALITGFLIGSYALPNTSHFIFIIAACFLVVVPDLVEAPFYFFNKENKAIKKWVKFKRSIQTDIPLFWGLLTQVVVYTAAFWWVFN